MMGHQMSTRIELSAKYEGNETPMSGSYFQVPLMSRKIYHVVSLGRTVSWQDATDEANDLGTLGCNLLPA